MDEKIDRAIEITKKIIPALTVPDDMQKASQSLLNLTQAKSLYDACRSTDDVDAELAFMLGRVRSNLGATELMKVTQAVLNLMHAKSQGDQSKPSRTPKPKTN